MQRRRIQSSTRGARSIQERLRTTELELEEASRVLRRAQARVALARQTLEEFESRHWALLSMYSPEQAEERISEALKEFEPYLGSGSDSLVEEGNISESEKVDERGDQSTMTERAEL